MQGSNTNPAAADAASQSNPNWNEMYLRLVAYESVHSNAKVPRPYHEDPQLGEWVYTQRLVYNSNQRFDLIDAYCTRSWNITPN